LSRNGVFLRIYEHWELGCSVTGASAGCCWWLVLICCERSIVGWLVLLAGADLVLENY